MTQEKSWSKKDQQRLIELYQSGDKFNEIATKLNRTYSSIASEVQELRKAGKLSWCAFGTKHIIKYQNDCPDSIRAAANERGLFKPDSVEFEDNGINSVEFEDNGIMIRPSDEEAEQAERAERKAITTENQMIDINFHDLKSINTYLFMMIVKNAAGYYAQRTKSQIVSIFGKNFWICEVKKQTFPDKCKECYLNSFCNSSLKVNSRPNAESWCAFDAKHIIKYQNDCPDSIRDAMTAKTARTNSVFNEILENIK